ncbi:MAG: flagellar biosynthetic protein FliQ [Myxococcota bacterium]|nr:flagellar biosynthetic protein FliQ [Myxococcota bacterium]
MDVVREGFVLALVLCIPILGAALAAGLMTSLLGMFTKISEPAIAHVARIAAISLVLLATAPWIFGRVARFAERIWSLVQAVEL